MEKVICYTSSSSENGNKVYSYYEGNEKKKVEYSYRNATNLHFLIIKDKIKGDRSLVLLERQESNKYSTKHGREMEATMVPSDDSNNVFETLDNTINILSSFPFEDIDDISCGRHYRDDEVGAIYNGMNSLIIANYGQELLPTIKGRVLYKDKNN